MSPFAVKINDLDTQINQRKLELHAAQKQAELDSLTEEFAYQRGDPSTVSRIDAKRQQRQATQRQNKIQAQQRLLAERKVQIGDRLTSFGEGLGLLTAAKVVEQPSATKSLVRTKVAESIIESYGFVPFDYNYLGGLFNTLYQVQGLIRELFPYKPTILRYIQALDFARWACRVLYEECPTAKGLIRCKTNFVIRRGLKCSVVPRELPKGAASVDKTPAQKKAQWFIDQFREINDYSELERERFSRRCIDGEFFNHISCPENLTEKGVCCEASFIEPDYVRPSFKDPDSMGQEDPAITGFKGEDWSFGILTAKHKYFKPLVYQIVWNTNSDEEKIDASWMIHGAERERSNIKRCLPPLLSSADDLIRMTILRQALADASKWRASIAGVIKYDVASPDSSYGNICNNDDDGYEVNNVNISGHANLIELPPGRDFVTNTVFPKGDTLELVMDWHIRAIAQQWGMPEWAVKGASAGASFADSLTAESPSVVEFETEQAKECRFTKRACIIELRCRVDSNELPANFFEEYDISVEPDSIITRDSKAEMETAKMALETQVASLRTTRAKLGYDPAIEEKLIAAEKALGVGPVWDKEAREGRQEQSDEGPETTDGKRQELEGSKE